MVRSQAGAFEQTRQLEQSADAGLAKWQDTLANWKQLASQARTQGRAIDLWQAHSVRVNDKQFSRQEADAFLGSLFTNDQALVVPETFSIRLSGRQNSLLVAKPADDEDKAVFITLIGTYYSRGSMSHWQQLLDLEGQVLNQSSAPAAQVRLPEDLQGPTLLISDFASAPFGVDTLPAHSKRLAPLLEKTPARTR